MTFLDDGAEISVIARPILGGWRLRLPGGELEAMAEAGPAGRLTALIENVEHTATVVRHGPGLAAMTVIAPDATHQLVLVDPLAQPETRAAPAGALVAPMSGTVTAVMVKSGDAVQQGTPLIAIEAMKMEHTIRAPADGIIEAVHFTLGQQVEGGAQLVDFKPADEG